MTTVNSSVNNDGYAIVEGVFTAEECTSIVAHLDSVTKGLAGSRCLLESMWARELASTVQDRLCSVLPNLSKLLAVQCTYFHKTATTNWGVAWHQDRSIPVAFQVESSKLTGWSAKEGTLFVHGPDVVLAEMIAVRLHLDDSTQDNGPLRILPGSHQQGTLSIDQVEIARNNIREVACTVRKGGVIVMRPLLLHASSKSTTRKPRRVLHYLFGPSRLPFGLSWSQSVKRQEEVI